MAPLVLSSRLREARAQLVNLSKITDEESEDEYEDNGIPVTNRVTINKVRAFLEMETTRLVSFRYIKEKLFAVDFPTIIHSRGSGEISRVFSAESSLFVGGQENFELQGDIFIPDYGFGPKMSLNPNNPSTLVIEFALSQSLKSVYRSATRYLDPTTDVQIVICCKIWGTRANGSKAMLFMLFERNNVVYRGYVTPTQVVCFGTAQLHHSVATTLRGWGVPIGALTGYLQPLLPGNLPPCTGHGQANYVIVIPAAQVYHGSAMAIPAAVAATGFVIDLYSVQRQSV